MITMIGMDWEQDTTCKDKVGPKQIGSHPIPVRAKCYLQKV